MSDATMSRGSKEIRPFRVEVPQTEIDELGRRLQATRWPEQETVADQSPGVPLATMQALVGGPRGVQITSAGTLIAW